MVFEEQHDTILHCFPQPSRELVVRERRADPFHCAAIGLMRVLDTRRHREHIRSRCMARRPERGGHDDDAAGASMGTDARARIVRSTDNDDAHETAHASRDRS